MARGDRSIPYKFAGAAEKINWLSTLLSRAETAENRCEPSSALAK